MLYDIVSLVGINSNLVMSKLILTIIKEQQRVSHTYNSLAVHKLVLGIEGIKEYTCLYRGCRR
jgi:hypothetical protein